MRQLFYLSRTARDVKESDIQEILARARSNNWRLGVTGCLLFSGSHFAQVLEGESSALETLATRIAADRRHSGFQVIRDRDIDLRRYPSWSMGFLYNVDFADRLENALTHPRSLSDQELSDLLGGMRVDSLMGPL